MNSAHATLTPLLASGGFWFPQDAAVGAGPVDELFFFILAVCVFFFALIIGLMTFFIIRYRNRLRMDALGGEAATHNTGLEIAWSVIPSILVGIIFYRGFTTYLDSRQPPDNSYEIQVVAKKWSWAFIYPNGHVDNNLHVPVDRPVKLVMSSDDVIHSLFVPAFRVKMDLVPGRYSTTWFEASVVGEYTLFCTEYCGTGHSTMNATAVVHPPGEFETWLKEADKFLEELPPEEAGEILYMRRGCVQCHSIDGSAKAGPTFKDVYGTQQLLTSGETITVDENYIRESILEPQSKVRQGYRPVMPTYQGQLDDQEISALIQYIKSLRGDAVTGESNDR